MSGPPFGHVRRGRKSTRKAKTLDRIGRLTIRLRDKDDMPFSMTQLKQALFQLIHELEPHAACRVKNVAVYLTAVNPNGEEVSLNGESVWNIFPYRSAADDMDRNVSRILDAGPDRETSHDERPVGS